MLFKKIVLILFLIQNLAYAQLESNEFDSTFITRFSFRQFSGGVIVVKAAFENIKDSLNFILDTGSGGISLDSATCEEFNIDSRLSDTTITGIGGKRKVSFSFNKTLHFPGFDLKKLNFHINNYEILTAVYGEKIDGIIGYSLFSRYIVKINFDSLYISIHHPGKIDYPRGGTLLKPQINAIPVYPLSFKDGKRMRSDFYFDTGAGLCLLLAEQYAQDSNFLMSKRKPVVTQTEGMVGMVQMKLTVVKEVKLGPHRFYNVPTYLYKDDYNVLRYPTVKGLFGNELLRRFNMIINYGQKEIHLLPNSHFGEPFDYSYTGLGFYVMDGNIQVEDVVKDSPADKAGFKVGDIIVCVGSNCSNKIQSYKNKLLVANQRIKVVVRRDNQLLELNIKTGSIL
ncbi:MAG TPA: aspartyl protease family protein [Ferruginibacter sp.]|nr:aspartyl protease family protein [Ferruginibacter sp.]HRE64347.1 aspartyl protease family protein [Ferruginibacter sp.]